MEASSVLIVLIIFIVCVSVWYDLRDNRSNLYSGAPMAKRKHTIAALETKKEVSGVPIPLFDRDGRAIIYLPNSRKEDKEVKNKPDRSEVFQCHFID